MRFKNCIHLMILGPNPLPEGKNVANDFLYITQKYSFQGCIVIIISCYYLALKKPVSQMLCDAILFHRMKVALSLCIPAAENRTVTVRT